MQTHFKRIITTLIISIMVAGTAFAGGQGEAAEVAETSDTPESVTVRFAEVAWTDIVATTASTRLVLEALGYQTTAVMVAVPMAYEGMSGGDVDVFLGNWMPSMATISNEYFDRGTVIQNRANLEGAKYTLATPAYMADEGLTDFADIADFAEELDYTIHGIEPGNDGNQVILDMIAEDAFGLGEFSLAESSEAGMLAEAQARERQQEPIVFLGWAPHPMNNFLDMEYLSGGDDYFGPDYGAATVYTNTREGFLDAYPNLERFFDNLYFTLEMEGAIMGAIGEGADARDAAEEWLSENPAILQDWLDGVRTVDGEPGLPAVRSALGL
jgi:glycine betaine/proline transport system substrate-binding protein